MLAITKAFKKEVKIISFFIGSNNVWLDGFPVILGLKMKSV